MAKGQIGDFSAYLNQAIKILPGSIYFKDVNGFYLGCNDFQAQMAGFHDPQEMIGKTDYDLPWKDYADTVRETERRIMKNKVPEEIIEYGIRHDGSEVIMLTNKSPLYDQFNQVIGVVGTSIDITERRKAERREQEALLKIITIEREKQQSLRMQGGAIAHEMRTPLSAIGSMAAGLKQYLPTLLETQASAQEKDPSIPRVSKGKLQTLSRIPDGLTSVTRSAFTVIDMLLMNLKDDVAEGEMVRCAISACVGEALDEYALAPEEQDLIIVRIEQDFDFQGHPVAIKHVFFNLLKNALHYLKAAGKGKITIWTEVGPNENRLYFEDTGKGMSKDILPHIFDQFFTRTTHGTGLGLAFCKMVMTKLGGDITCDSVEGEFTRFTLTFPALKSSKGQ